MRLNKFSNLVLSLFAYNLLYGNVPIAKADKPKFESWFPGLSRSTYEPFSINQCNETLDAYHERLRNASKIEQAARCSEHQACILRTLREDLKSRMASASVLLGLTPGLLASIGPSVVETAVLSTQKPLLSMLISLGCPAVYPSRVLAFEDARDMLHIQPYQSFSTFKSSSFISSTMFMILEYIVLVAAAGNVFYTSYDLGTKTVVSFRCVNNTLPLVWTVLALFVHIFASAAFYTKLRHFWSPNDFFSRQSQADTSSAYLPGHNNTTDMYQHQRPSPLVHRDSDLEERVKPTNRSIVLNYIATFLGFLHVVFGSMIFSSLLFIEILDVTVVVLRYMMSTLLARSILIFELDLIRRQRQQQLQQYKLVHYPPQQCDPVSATGSVNLRSFPKSNFVQTSVSVPRKTVGRSVSSGNF